HADLGGSGGSVGARLTGGSTDRKARGRSSGGNGAERVDVVETHSFRPGPPRTWPTMPRCSARSGENGRREKWPAPLVSLPIPAAFDRARGRTRLHRSTPSRRCCTISPH